MGGCGTQRRKDEAKRRPAHFVTLTPSTRATKHVCQAAWITCGMASEWQLHTPKLCRDTKRSEQNTPLRGRGCFLAGLRGLTPTPNSTARLRRLTTKLRHLRSDVRVTYAVAAGIRFFFWPPTVETVGHDISVLRACGARYSSIPPVPLPSIPPAGACWARLWRPARRGGRDSVHFARGPGSDEPGYDCCALRARVW